jgi:RNA polymerase sigma factor for flagellar operon FliA
MQPEEIFLEHLRTIERIAAFVCRRNHLSPDESAEFAQEVKLRLIDDDYAVIRKFEGRSQFPTYLTTVIQRLFHQWRVEQWGKWRPSAEAKRLGDKAITIERLLTRDNFTYHEVVQILTTSDSGYTEAEIDAIYLRLPLRHPRPVLVSGEVSPDAVAADANADDRIETEEREQTARSASSCIDRFLDTMEAEDRLILQMRFWEARKVPDIAERLHLEQKKVYKRLDKLFASLRRALEEAGIRRNDVDSLLVKGDQDLRFGPSRPASGNPPFRPSQAAGGEVVGGGKGRMR